ncbi:Basigin [Armadillidium nasatum]|uniref:Basigin n=1 Tax=Armadillidium nasatum TaxID=96803 RepID=A0A5N5SUI0_9CRUS|nr:Basigin [Armadillidium nasatum]
MSILVYYIDCLCWNIESLLRYKNDDLISSDDAHYKIFANSTLLIPKTTKEDVGVYRCQTVGFTPVKSFNIILYKKDLPKSMTVLEGDKLTITCDTEGVPMPIITWLKDGVSVDEAVNSSRFTYEQNEKGTENATYIVESAAYSDRAEYACFISTGDLQFNTTIFVRVKDMYAALWPFLGICAEVFILCLIIFIYEKRRAKADFEESDTDQPTEQKKYV